MDLLMLCNHRDVEILFNGNPTLIGRGQYLTSVRKLSEKWRWGKDRTLRYLRLLESLSMIHRESDTRRTLITVVNYEVYQTLGTEECDTNEDSNKDTHKDTDKDTRKPQTINVNKLNKLNKLNNIYNVHFEEFWKNYPRKEGKGEAYKKYLARCKCGWSEEELLEACVNYANDCKKTKREKQYIKHPKTFLSDTEPFVDYLKKGEQSGTGVSRLSSNNEISDAESRAIYENDECPF